MAEDIVDLTGGLYHFLLKAERWLWSRRVKNVAEQGLLEHAESLSQSLREHAESFSHSFSEARRRAVERVSSTLAEISASLRDFMTELDARRASRRQLRALWKRLGMEYEALVAHVRQLRLPVSEGIRFAHIKPRNIWRNLFHASMGVLGVLLYELVLSRGQVIAIGGGLLLSFVGLDVLRRASPNWNARLVQRIFGPISRPSEAHRIPSATWYLSALVLGVVVYPQHAIELGALALAFGDPVASLVGKRWGTRELLFGKSLVGSLSFFAAATAAGWVFLALAVPALGPAAALGVAAAVALVGAVTELLSTRLDDNFTIPMVCGLAALLLL